MVASLTVPTATSVHPVPAKLLEVNRSVLNDELQRSGREKVSFTHLIGWAVVRALGEVPALNSSFVEDADGKGTPGVVRHTHVGLGLAIDLERPDGSRTLVVPVIKDADTLDFVAFVSPTRSSSTKRARASSTSTTSPARPSRSRTRARSARLSRCRGSCAAKGRSSASARSTIRPSSKRRRPRPSPRSASARSSRSPRPTTTASSKVPSPGSSCAGCTSCSSGADGFYDDVFASLGVLRDAGALGSRRAVRRQRDEAEIRKELKVQSLINMYRVRGHLIAHLDPLQTEPPTLHAELDPAHYGLSVWDLDRRFHTGRTPRNRDPPAFAEILEILRDAYCRTVGVEYMHIQSPDEKRWIQRHVEGVSTDVTTDEKRHILERLNAAEAFETLPPPALRRPEALRTRGGGVDDPVPRRDARGSGTRRSSTRS